MTDPGRFSVEVCVCVGGGVTKKPVNNKFTNLKTWVVVVGFVFVSLDWV